MMHCVAGCTKTNTSMAMQCSQLSAQCAAESKVQCTETAEGVSWSCYGPDDSPQPSKAAFLYIGSGKDSDSSQGGPPSDDDSDKDSSPGTPSDGDSGKEPSAGDKDPSGGGAVPVANPPYDTGGAKEPTLGDVKKAIAKGDLKKPKHHHTSSLLVREASSPTPQSCDCQDQCSCEGVSRMMHCVAGCSRSNTSMTMQCKDLSAQCSAESKIQCTETAEGVSYSCYGPNDSPQQAKAAFLYIVS